MGPKFYSNLVEIENDECGKEVTSKSETLGSTPLSINQNLQLTFNSDYKNNSCIIAKHISSTHLTHLDLANLLGEISRLFYFDHILAINSSTCMDSSGLAWTNDSILIIFSPLTLQIARTPLD